MDTLKGIFDQYDDDGQLLRKEFAGHDVPTIIKTAANLSGSSVKNGADYALKVSTARGVEYRYPIVDAGNTIASAFYFSKYGSALPEDLQTDVASKLNDALTSFGFEPPESMTKTAAATLGKSKVAEELSLERLFGVGGPESDLEVIEEAFDGMSPRGKRKLMLQVKEAGLLEHLSEDMSDYASDALGSDFSVAIDTRKMSVLGEEAIAELDGIAKIAQSTDLTELAEKLASFDKKHEISHLYNRVIPDPYASVFGNSVEKTASAVQSTLDIDGREYPAKDIVDWFGDGGEAQLEQTFDSDFVSQFQADPAGVLESLPITHKKIIAGMIDKDSN
jgi:hypothetical protein